MTYGLFKFNDTGPAETYNNRLYYTTQSRIQRLYMGLLKSFDKGIDVDGNIIWRRQYLPPGSGAAAGGAATGGSATGGGATGSSATGGAATGGAATGGAAGGGATGVGAAAGGGAAAAGTDSPCSPDREISS